MADLRRATAGVHARVEAALPSLDGLASPEGYARALRELHAFFSAWEPPVFEALEPLAGPLELSERRKLPSLVADLEALGIPELPERCPSPAPLSLAAALGAMYVMEGSTLGAQLIARSTEPALGVSARHGGAFYHGYGARTGERWRTFGAVVTAEVNRLGTGGEVVAGGVQCFGSLEQWLARSRVP